MIKSMQPLDKIQDESTELLNTLHPSQIGVGVAERWCCSYFQSGYWRFASQGAVVALWALGKLLLNG